MKVLRITNPAAMDLDPIGQLLERAEKALPGTHPAWRDLSDWLRKNLEDEDIAFLVAFASPLEPSGYMLISFHTDLWNAKPWVVSVHAESRQARKGLAVACGDELKRRGLDSVRAINQTGASDRAYAWLWRDVATVKVLGPVVELTAIPEGGTETP